MARVETTTDYIELDGDYGGTVAGVEVTCDRCGYSVESFGTDEPSLKRCGSLLREECPRGERNFYVVDE